MSNIKISEPVSRNQIRDILSRRCPDLELGSLGPMLTASVNGWGGASVAVNKKVVSVGPAPRTGGVFALTMFICLTGVGLIIFAVTVLPKWLDTARRVKAVLAEELPTR